MKYYLIISFSLVLNTVFAQKNKFDTLKTAIESYPDSLVLQEIFIKEVEHDSLFYRQYYNWIEKFPKSYSFSFLLGRELTKKEDPRVNVLLLNAVRINPNLPEAWYELSIDAQRRGDKRLEIEYIDKAAELEPKNGNYAFNAAYVNYGLNDGLADSLLLIVSRKFRNNEYGAKALFFLAEKSEKKIVKESYWQQLYEIYLDKPNIYFNNGMQMYFTDLIIGKEYKQAFDLSLSLSINIDRDYLKWVHLNKIARQYLAVDDFLKCNKIDSALNVLDKIKLHDSFTQSWVDADESLLILKSDLLARSSNTDTAYHLLLKNYAFSPSKSVLKSLFFYGNQIGKDTLRIIKDIKSVRYLNSPDAKNITRINLLDSSLVSINDLKGKVVLLSLWFPGCGPCRKEMPHIENVLKKINRNELVYLAINVEPKQDVLVKSFLDKTGFTFIPLNDDLYDDKGNLAAEGYPTNFLIDKQGKIVFKYFLVNDDSEDSLEMMINDLINY